MLEDVEMEYRWGGRLCLSRNGVQVFGEIEKRAFCSLLSKRTWSFQGDSAEFLRGACLPIQNQYIEDQLNEAQPTRLPPEPFATIGATAYLNWQEWRPAWKNNSLSKPLTEPNFDFFIFKLNILPFSF
ncbi:MAG: hypothetical protein CM1200mP30_15900 [Pseudomonadota bacterium]|nr:MAG: hypothetical protein CM1200mP30_15900 [Pseudomonadota bacterium]